MHKEPILLVSKNQQNRFVGSRENAISVLPISALLRLRAPKSARAKKKELNVRQKPPKWCTYPIPCENAGGTCTHRHFQALPTPPPGHLKPKTLDRETLDTCVWVEPKTFKRPYLHCFFRPFFLAKNSQKRVCDLFYFFFCLSNPPFGLPFPAFLPPFLF